MNVFSNNLMSPDPENGSFNTPTAKKLLKQAAIAHSERADSARIAHQRLSADLSIIPAALEKPLVEKMTEVHGNSMMIQTQFKKLEGDVVALNKQTKKWKQLVGSSSKLTSVSTSKSKPSSYLSPSFFMGNKKPKEPTSIVIDPETQRPKTKMGRDVDELQEKAEVADREIRVLEEMIKIIRENEY